MTARSSDKTAARSLAILTGAPYQSCLAALPVLRCLPRGTDNEELTGVLAGVEPLRHLTLGLEDRAHVQELLKRHSESWIDPDTEVFLHDVKGETLIHTTVVPPTIEVPATATLLIDDVFFAPLPRPGVWRTTVRRWKRAFGIALRTEEDDWSVDVGACRSDPSFVPPEKGMTLELPKDRLGDVAAEEVAGGPGFSWLRLSFASLDLDPKAVARAHHHTRWSLRERGMSDTEYLVPPEAVTIPDILLEVWRDLAPRFRVAEEEALRPRWHQHDDGEEAPSWYGLSLPDYSILWLRVAPHRRNEAVPWT